MPWDWTREERAREERAREVRAREERGREERATRRDDRRRPNDDDFGLADYSTDYGYDPGRRAGFRAADEEEVRRADYGQADYSTDFAYDTERGRAYRRYADDGRGDDGRGDDEGSAPRGYGGRMDRRNLRPEERGERDYVVGEQSRSWTEARRRRGPSDRVLWAVIVERLEDQRGLDLRDVEVVVDNAEVTLNGTVRRKEDKRRIEDLADLDEVRQVQNNLRIRERRWF
jgi:hypothetical protein